MLWKAGEQFRGTNCGGIGTLGSLKDFETVCSRNASLVGRNPTAIFKVRIAPMMKPNGSVSMDDSRAKSSKNGGTPISNSTTNFNDEAGMRRVFERVDEDHDGAISSDELRRFAEELGFNMSAEEVQSLLKTVDENGDGSVNFEEFYALYSRSQTDSEQSGNDNSEEEDLKIAFRVYDRDGDGYIDALELRSVLMSLKIKEGASLKKCQQMIKSVDADGNGKVDFQEFKKMMSSGAF